MIRSLTTMLVKTFIRYHAYRSESCYSQLRRLINETARLGQMDELDEVVALDLARRHNRHLNKADGWRGWLEGRVLA